MQTIKRKRVTDGQAAVYSALSKYGPLPDHALVPIVQHAEGAHQSSSSIRSRRAELVKLRLVAPTTTRVKTASGRTARVFETV